MVYAILFPGDIRHVRRRIQQVPGGKSREALMASLLLALFSKGRLMTTNILRWTLIITGTVFCLRTSFGETANAHLPDTGTNSSEGKVLHEVRKAQLNMPRLNLEDSSKCPSAEQLNHYVLEMNDWLLQLNPKISSTNSTYSETIFMLHHGSDSPINPWRLRTGTREGLSQFFRVWFLQHPARPEIHFARRRDREQAKSLLDQLKKDETTTSDKGRALKWQGESRSDDDNYLRERLAELSAKELFETLRSLSIDGKPIYFGSHDSKAENTIPLWVYNLATPADLSGFKAVDYYHSSGGGAAGMTVRFINRQRAPAGFELLAWRALSETMITAAKELKPSLLTPENLKDFELVDRCIEVEQSRELNFYYWNTVNKVRFPAVEADGAP